MEDGIFAHADIACAIIAALFICFQLRAIFNGQSKRNRAGKSMKNQAKREMIDKSVETASGYEVFDYLSYHQLPYESAKITNDEAVYRSQLYYEKMRGRRSIRKFSDRRIPSKLIENLIKIAGTSPSDGNHQPWVYCVITNDIIKRRIQKFVEDEDRRIFSKRTGVSWVAEVKQIKSWWSKPYLSEAPYLIVVLYQNGWTNDGGLFCPYRNSCISTSISVGILISSLQSIGLTTVCITPTGCEEHIRVLLRRPEHENVLMLLPIGFPSAEATVPDLKHKLLEQIIACYF